jgi:hypothetical protein
MPSTIRSVRGPVRSRPGRLTLIPLVSCPPEFVATAPGWTLAAEIVLKRSATVSAPVCRKSRALESIAAEQGYGFWHKSFHWIIFTLIAAQYVVGSVMLAYRSRYDRPRMGRLAHLDRRRSCSLLCFAWRGGWRGPSPGRVLPRFPAVRTEAETLPTRLRLILPLLN